LKLQQFTKTKNVFRYLQDFEMPASQPQPANRPHRSTSNSTHAAIIVGVLIGVLAIVAMVLFLWDRRRRQGVKKGFGPKSRIATPHPRNRVEEEKEWSQLEVGIIHEPLPVYQKEPGGDQRRI
jgi:hypothetical protein